MRTADTVMPTQTSKLTLTNIVMMQASPARTVSSPEVSEANGNAENNLLHVQGNVDDSMFLMCCVQVGW